MTYWFYLLIGQSVDLVILCVTQLLWAVLFTLGLIWNPLGRQDLWIIIMELNDYGIFCMECSMMVLADDPLPPHSALTISVLCLFYWPFNVVWLWSKLNSSELSTAECWPVTTVCMLADLKPPTDRVPFFLLCMQSKSIYLPADLHLPSTCLLMCQSLVLPLLSLSHTQTDSLSRHSRYTIPATLMC